MEVDKPVVERLDVDNYATWKSRMKFLLITKGLWAAVSGDTADPVADQKALAHIGLYVKEHHLPTLERCGTAKDAWQELERVYQAKSNARKLQLRKELTTLRMGPGEPLTKFAARAKDIQNQLRVAGYMVPDQDVTWSVLAGLPAAYDTMVTVLETTSESEMSLDAILPKLLQVEQRQQQEKRLDESALSAKFRHGTFVSNRGSTYPGPGFGSTDNNRGSTYSGPRKETRICHYCKKPGHLRKDCYQKKRDDARRAQQTPQLSAIALTASAADTSPHRWVLDTGASRHITPNSSILINARPTPEDITITFGNGDSGTATQIGGVLLRTSTAEFLITDVLYIPEATEYLISVKAATKHGLEFTFAADYCEITCSGKTLAMAPSTTDAIYYLTGYPPTAAAL